MYGSDLPDTGPIGGIGFQWVGPNPCRNCASGWVAIGPQDR